jgi:two-component system LytT family sensor kinase
MFGTNMRSPETQYSRFPVILVHLLFWAAFLLLPLVFIDAYDDRIRFLRFWGYQIVLTAIYYYLNYLIFIPRILFRKKLALYILTLFMVLGLMMVITHFYRELLHDLGIYKQRETGFDWKVVFIPLYPCILAFGISTFVRLTGQWMSSERHKQELENEKLISELGFLKSQINPHFLFNTLNNICSLARKKSDETENALIKLSEIMRYMIDESKEDKVLLSKEIEYLNNYIELQRLRLSGKVKILFAITGDPTTKMIDPLLLIPFVENAFKHGISYREEPLISISLKIRDNALNFQIENTVFRSNGESLPDEPGIGLRNVRRRLDLLYPEKHELRITEEGEKFRVDLTIRFQ